MMNQSERERIVSLYEAHADRFQLIAAKRAHRLDVLAPVEPMLPEPTVGLTAREISVLELVSMGLSNNEIGRRLLIAEETVKTHVRRILAKLNARNRAHAVALGIRWGSISLAAA